MPRRALSVATRIRPSAMRRTAAMRRGSAWTGRRQQGQSALQEPGSATRTMCVMGRRTPAPWSTGRTTSPGRPASSLECARRETRLRIAMAGRKSRARRERRQGRIPSVTASTMTATARWTRTTSPCRRPAASAPAPRPAHLVRGRVGRRQLHAWDCRPPMTRSATASTTTATAGGRGLRLPADDVRRRSLRRDRLDLVRGRVGRRLLHAWNAPAADDSICNGIDDDCSGPADEDYVSLPTPAASALAQPPATSCVAGSVVDSCTPGTRRPPMTRSVTASTMTAAARWTRTTSPLPTTCGVGACAATGATSCVAGSVVDSCTPGTAGCRMTRLQRHRR